MKKRVLEKIISGLSDQNIRFNDLRGLLLALGFNERIKGDHHIFTKQSVIEIVNLQPLENGKAKSYQVKQVRTILMKYQLHKGILYV